MKRWYDRAGFTLLEMSIVLIIIGIVVSGVMVVFTDSIIARQLRETTVKFDTIQQALYDYRIANNRLPCPADVNMVVGDANFGVEGVNPGDCATGATYNGTGVRTAVSPTGPTANFIQSPAAGAQDAREGLVPVHTLQLPDEYAFDSWGRRIMYAVAKDVTSTGAMNAIPGSDATNRMTIKNAEASNDSTQAAYVLISFGPNGHGSFPRLGGATRLNASSTNVDEQQNCDCDVSAAATGLNGIFVQKDATLDSTSRFDSFDDVVAYGTRADLVLQSSLYWTVVSNGTAFMCPTVATTCVTSNGIKSCTCNR